MLVVKCFCRPRHNQPTVWRYRIAANHVLNMKRRGGEPRPQTFSSYAATTSQRCRRGEAVFKNQKVTLVFIKKDEMVMILVSGSETIKLPAK